ncbi:MAG: hypothetical protein ABSA17_05885 [Rhabdochlamydiaceae bacterium]|jgi:hypothetical protein
MALIPVDKHGKDLSPEAAQAAGYGFVALASPTNLTADFFSSKVNGFTSADKKKYSYVEWFNDAGGWFSRIKNYIARRWLVSEKHIVIAENPTAPEADVLTDNLDRELKFYQAVVKAKNAFRAFVRNKNSNTHAAAKEAFETLHADWTEGAGAAETINKILTKELALEAGKKQVPDISRALLEFSVGMALTKDGLSPKNILNNLDPEKLEQEFTDLKAKGYRPELTEDEQSRRVSIEDSRIDKLYRNHYNIFMTYANIYSALAKTPYGEEVEMNTEKLDIDLAVKEFVNQANIDLLSALQANTGTIQVVEEEKYRSMAAKYAAFKEAIKTHEDLSTAFSQPTVNLAAKLDQYGAETISLELSDLDELFEGVEYVPYQTYKQALEALKANDEQIADRKRIMDESLKELYVKRKSLSDAHSEVAAELVKAKEEVDAFIKSYSLTKMNGNELGRLEGLYLSADTGHQRLTAELVTCEEEIKKIKDELASFNDKTHALYANRSELEANVDAAKFVVNHATIVGILSEKVGASVNNNNNAPQAYVSNSTVLARIQADYQIKKEQADTYTRERAEAAADVTNAKEAIDAAKSELVKLGFKFNDGNTITGVEYKGFMSVDFIARKSEQITQAKNRTIDTVDEMRRAVDDLNPALHNAKRRAKSVPVSEGRSGSRPNAFDLEI